MEPRTTIVALLSLMAVAACSPIAPIAGGLADAGLMEDRQKGFSESVSDEFIAASVRERIMREDARLLARLTVRVHRGRVLLVGRLDDPWAKSRLLDAISRIDGVRAVHDGLTPARRDHVVDAVKDAWIRTELSTRIMTDRAIVGQNYETAVLDADVYVIGTARSHAERRRLLDQIRSIAGVRRVVEHVQVAF